MRPIQFGKVYMCVRSNNFDSDYVAAGGGPLCRICWCCTGVKANFKAQIKVIKSCEQLWP